VELRTEQRLRDSITAVNDIESLLAGKSFSDLNSDRHLRAAFERYIEILSEASRHIPETLKSQSSQIPWPDVANIGNHIRHAYHRVDPEVLWTTFERGDLAAVKAACVAFIGQSE
jgi:uncharacterized protein with HEPN domain